MQRVENVKVGDNLMRSRISALFKIFTHLYCVIRFQVKRLKERATLELWN